MQEEATRTELVPDTPEMTTSLKSKRPTVSSAGHAHEIVAGLFKDNEERVEEAAKIRKKSDGIDPPFDSNMLEEEGKSHKRNFSTGFMGSVMERIVPRLVMRVKSSRYLTSSRMPANVDKAHQKTEHFRSVVTDTIRNWSGWNFFLYMLADDDVKFGKSFVSYDDPLEWRPSIYRLDDCAIPNGTKQGESPDYFGIRWEYSVSDMFAFIADREAAEAAGWDIDNVIASINAAKPIREEKEDTPSQEAITYEDIELELIQPDAFTKDWNNVRVEILYVKEHDKTVSVWVVNRETQDELFHAENLYEIMDDVIQPICYDIGNGTVYGSMGVGQKLYDLALNIEKSRNMAFDQLANRGKFILYTQDKNQLNEIETSITDEAIYISGAEINNSKAALPDNADAFIALDRYTRGLAEEKVGAFQPESQATDKTATQSQIDALKENETRDAKLDYWLTYAARVVAMMQRRMMNPETDDEQALLAQRRCLEVMNRDELDYIASQPPMQTGMDWTDMKQAQIMQFLSTKLGSASWNQDWVERTLATLAIGQEMANAGMWPENDKTMMIEATRQQQDETFTMSAQGVPVLVSPRDSHMIHMQAISGQEDPNTGKWDGQLFALLSEQNIEGASALLAHYQGHFQEAMKLEQLGEYQNVVKKFMAAAQNAVGQATQMAAAYDQQQQQLNELIQADESQTAPIN